MKTLTALTACLLSACATPPQFLANHFDRMDPCQTREFASDGARLKPQGYQQPYGCGGTRTTTAVIRNSQGQIQGYLTTK
jgi:starvation-inducible outer membrane lipoprotein